VILRSQPPNARAHYYTKAFGTGLISPNQLEPRKSHQKLAQHPPEADAITILNVRSMHHNGQQQSYVFINDMAVAPLGCRY
jgi:hypothetical protein